jgi:hypothetical protein
MYEPFQPPEATADAPPPEATADPPASVLDVGIYRPPLAYGTNITHQSIQRSFYDPDWMFVEPHVSIRPSPAPAVGFLEDPWNIMFSRARSLTETRDPLRTLMRLPITTFGFDITLARALNAARIFQETNLAPEESRSLDVVCPALPPGPARSDRPARRE